jgi:hypothetical protein
MEGDGEENAIARFAQQAKFVGNNPLALNFDAAPHAFEYAGVWSFGRADVIFLFKPKPRVHDPVRQFAIIGQQEQAFGFPIEPADGVEALACVDEIHDGAAVAFIAGGGDKALGLVEHHVAKLLRTAHLTVNADDIGFSVGLGAKFRDDSAVD